MHNPITGNRVYLFAYILVWVILAIVQASMVFFIFDTSFDFAVSDSIIFNLIFAILGIAIWFPVRYMSTSGKKGISIFLNQAVLALVILAIWLFLGYYLVKLVASEDSHAMNFLSISLPYRSFLGALIIVVLIMLYYLMVYSENLRQKINNEANLITLIREAELSALKAQINPHFLFNALNSISSLTTRDPSKTRKMIIELSDFLRYSLKHKEKEETSLSDEIQNISKYLEIEKIRFGERLIFSFEIPEPCKKLFLPNMILQPLFENAIKHGVYESIDPVTIKLKCNCDSKFMKISIINNFNDNMVPSRGTGIGLNNIKSRLKLIYNSEGLLETNSKEGIFEVILRIPLKVE